MRNLFAFSFLASQAVVQVFAESSTVPTGFSVFQIGYVDNECTKIGSVSWSKQDGDCSGWATSKCSSGTKSICVRGQSYKTLPEELKAWEWSAVEKYATSDSCQAKTGIHSAQLYSLSCASVSDNAALKYTCEYNGLTLRSYRDNTCYNEVSASAFPIEGVVAPNCVKQNVTVECKVVPETADVVTTPNDGAPTVAPTSLPTPGTYNPGANPPGTNNSYTGLKKDFLLSGYGDAGCKNFVSGSIIPNIYETCPPATDGTCSVNNNLWGTASGSTKSLCADSISYQDVATFTGSKKLIALEFYPTTEQCNKKEGLLVTTIIKAGICEKLGDVYVKFDCTDKGITSGPFMDDKCEKPQVEGDMALLRLSIPPLPFDCSNRIIFKCFDATATATTATATINPTAPALPIKNSAGSSQFSIFTILAVIIAVFAQ